MTITLVRQAPKFSVADKMLRITLTKEGSYFMDPQLVHNLLIGHSTIDLLKGFGLVIAGQSINGVAACRLSDAGDNRYRIEAPGGAGGYLFNAHNVPMQSEESNGVTMVIVPALNGVTLPAMGGPSIMVTGQLSGCSFVYQPRADGSIKVAHIQPGKRVEGDVADVKIATSGMSLSANLANTGRFVGNNGAVKVFGSNYYQHQYDDGISRCTIVGIRRINGWNFYAQMYTKQGRNVKNAVQFYGN